MKNTKNIDIFELGKNTFNSCFSQLKNDKKILRLYSQHIKSYLNSIEEHKNILKNINRDIEKNKSIDKPFSFLKKFEILLSFECTFYDYFYENSQKLLEHLKESIETNLIIITNFLSQNQDLAADIKTNSETYFENYEKLIKSIEETEKATIEDYIKSTYKININKDKAKSIGTEDIINETRKNEQEFINSRNDMKTKFEKFLMDYNYNMKELKLKMNILNEDCKADILNIIQVIKDNYNILLTLIDKGANKLANYDSNYSSFESDYSEYLNNEIKKEELIQALKFEKYNIKIINEYEKNLLEQDIYKPKNNNNKTTQNLILSAKDIYNIVEKLYSYNFGIINKKGYDLEKEKIKLKIIVKTGQLLGYDFFKFEPVKSEAIGKDEINDLINLIFSTDDNIIEFLSRLNNYRTTGNFELSIDLFNIIKIIFDKAADYMKVAPNPKIYNFMIILSQTFYIMKDNKKYFLQKELKNKEFFQSVDFWYNKIDKAIEEEFVRFEKELSKNNISLSEQKKQKKIEEIIFTKFVSFIASLNGFELEKEKIDKIVLPLLDKYKLSESMRESFLKLIDKYKK